MQFYCFHSMPWIHLPEDFAQRYDHPQRVAEELAMLDVITEGRVISGMVVGTGMEYFSYNINPTYARERFHEAHNLIIKAWTTEGPFAWEGNTTASASRTGEARIR
jgi:alkanesulfonate monooxygenase SsuD/methylene tetrahydromethanopterin reductase-like flavin-dependent oxidoreductase (luciferase family)